MNKTEVNRIDTTAIAQLAALQTALATIESVRLNTLMDDRTGFIENNVQVHYAFKMALVRVQINQQIARTAMLNFDFSTMTDCANHAAYDFIQHGTPLFEALIGSFSEREQKGRDELKNILDRAIKAIPVRRCAENSLQRDIARFAVYTRHKEVLNNFNFEEMIADLGDNPQLLELYYFHIAARTKVALCEEIAQAAMQKNEFKTFGDAALLLIGEVLQCYKPLLNGLLAALNENGESDFAEGLKAVCDKLLKRFEAAAN